MCMRSRRHANDSRWSNRANQSIFDRHRCAQARNRPLPRNAMWFLRVTDWLEIEDRRPSLQQRVAVLDPHDYFLRVRVSEGKCENEKHSPTPIPSIYCA